MKRGVQFHSGDRLHREALEYSVVDHCNLRCAGCDHSSPHLKKRFADPVEFAADMAALEPHLRVRVLRLLGGEPSLHPELEAFVRAARSVGIAQRIALWTNGLRLHETPLTTLKAFDVIHVSLYPGIKLGFQLHEVAGALRESGTQFEIAKINRFYHQLLNEEVRDQGHVRWTYSRCKEAHAWSCHTVYDGRYYKCTKPAFLGYRLANCGTAARSPLEDGVTLHHNPHLRRDLENYLSSNEPMLACRFCLGTDGKSFNHHQLSPREHATETVDSSAPWKNLVATPLTRVARSVRYSAQSLWHGFR